ncbi:MAG: hypothetical protein LBU11_08365 [Zoogloeaceae bacterium]|jgi:hypothetical protein|nr:hypothetical protein [Zoogloeaceae bacterium]
MKPKLWDGAHAVGEGKLRGAIATTNAPFLRVSGPGFHGYRKNRFSEIFLDGASGDEEEVACTLYASWGAESVVWGESVFHGGSLLPYQDGLTADGQAANLYIQFSNCMYLGYGVSARIDLQSEAQSIEYVAYAARPYAGGSSTLGYERVSYPLVLQRVSRDLSSCETQVLTTYTQDVQFTLFQLSYHITCNKRVTPVARAGNEMLFALFANEAADYGLHGTTPAFNFFCTLYLTGDPVRQVRKVALPLPPETLDGTQHIFGDCATLPDGAVLALIFALPWSDGKKVSQGRALLYTSRDECKSFTWRELELPDDLDRVSVPTDSRQDLFNDPLRSPLYKPNPEYAWTENEWNGESKDWKRNYAGPRNAVLRMAQSAKIMPCGRSNALLGLCAFYARNYFVNVQYLSPWTDNPAVRDVTKLNGIYAEFYYRRQEGEAHPYRIPMSAQNIEMLRACVKPLYFLYEDGVIAGEKPVVPPAMPIYPGLDIVLDASFKSNDAVSVSLSATTCFIICPGYSPAQFTASSEADWFPPADTIRARFLYTTDAGKTWQRHFFDGVFPNDYVSAPSVVPHTDGSNCILFTVRYLAALCDPFLRANPEAAAFAEKYFLHDNYSYTLRIESVKKTAFETIFTDVDLPYMNSILDYSAHIDNEYYVNFNVMLHRLDLLAIEGRLAPRNNLPLPRSKEDAP